MTEAECLERLRALMKTMGLDAFLIENQDAHHALFRSKVHTRGTLSQLQRRALTRTTSAHDVNVTGLTSSRGDPYKQFVTEKRRSMTMTTTMKKVEA